MLVDLVVKWLYVLLVHAHAGVLHVHGLIDTGASYTGSSASLRVSYVQAWAPKCFGLVDLDFYEL